MKSIFHAGWVERRGRNCSLVVDPMDACVGPVFEAPLVIGARGDPTAASFIRKVTEWGEPLSWIAFEDLLDKTIPLSMLANWIEGATGVYVRDTWIGGREALVIQAVVSALCDLHPNVIRAETSSTNWCKPLHVAALSGVTTRIARLPPTLLTRRHDLPDRVIKNCSSAPSFVIDGNSLKAIQEPVISQPRIVGREFRVHVLDSQCFAVEIVTDDLDYRKGAFDLLPADIDPLLAEDLCALTKSEGLRFSGIDIIISDGDIFVIEVNPMPGFHAYDLAPWGARSISKRLYQQLLRLP